MKLKPIDQQVVAVVGASSGIGRETALQFAKQRAKLVVSARSELGLNSLVYEIQQLGGEEGHQGSEARAAKKLGEGTRTDHSGTELKVTHADEKK